MGQWIIRRKLKYLLFTLGLPVHFKLLEVLENCRETGQYCYIYFVEGQNSS